MLRALGADAATLLPTVRVEATTPVFDPGATDGSGSYAATRVNSANGLNLDPRHTPHSMSVVTQQQMEDQNLTGIFDVLAQVPGVTLNHLDSERYGISIRGQDVNMMIDGSAAPGYFGGPSSEAQMISTATLDRVEVVRGSAGLLNGTGGYGGSVNLVRKRPIAGSALKGTLGAGSWDRYQAQIDVSTDLDKNGKVRSRWLVATEDGGSFTDDYDRAERTYYGIIEADLGARTVASIGVEKFIAKVDGTSFIHIPLYFDDGTIFHAPHAFNPAPPWTKTDLDNTTVFSNLQHRFNDSWKLNVAVSWINSEMEAVRGGFAPWAGPIDKQTGMISMFRSRLDQQGDRYTLDVRLEGAFEAFGRHHDLVIGANSHRAELGHYFTSFFFDDGSATVNIYDWPRDLPPYPDPADADASYLQPNDLRQTGVFAAAQLRLLDRLALIAGTRWQRHQYQASGFDLDAQETVETYGQKESGEFVPYAALVYDPLENVTAYLSYTSIFNLQDERNRAGKPLPPERGVNYEAGIKAELFGGRLLPAFSFFRRQTEDTALVDPGFTFPDGEQAFIAGKGVINRGWDFTVAGEPVPGWTLQGGIGASVDEGKGSESRFFTLSTAWAVTPTITVGGNVTGYPKRTANVDYSESIFDGEIGRYDLKSLTLVDLFASYRLSQTLRVSLNVENLTDEFYMESAGAYGGYVYGPDRNFMLLLRYAR